MKATFESLNPLHPDAQRSLSAGSFYPPGQNEAKARLVEAYGSPFSLSLEVRGVDGKTNSVVYLEFPARSGRGCDFT